MKTKEELENIKERLEKLNAELHELTDEELEQVTGGVIENKLENERIDEIKAKAKVKLIYEPEIKAKDEVKTEIGAKVLKDVVGDIIAKVEVIPYWKEHP